MQARGGVIEGCRDFLDWLHLSDAEREARLRTAGRAD
jgi:hypothetical protein